MICAAQYHFHERMTCLYEQSGGHSPKIGEANDGTPIYGMWENYETRELPLLDACGGQFGVTPDSKGEVIYHYHVQSKPPFTFGCYGPAMDGGLVTVEECRATYTECGDGDVVDLTTKDGTFEYDRWCPCYDADGSNVGVAPARGLWRAASGLADAAVAAAVAARGPAAAVGAGAVRMTPTSSRAAGAAPTGAPNDCLRGGPGIETEAAKAALLAACPVSCEDGTPVARWRAGGDAGARRRWRRRRRRRRRRPRRRRRRPRRRRRAAPATRTTSRRPGVAPTGEATRAPAADAADVETEVAKTLLAACPSVVQDGIARLRGRGGRLGRIGQAGKPAGPPEGKPEGQPERPPPSGGKPPSW